MPAEMSRLAERALDFVRDQTTLGLGSGRAATAFVHALGERVRAGLRVRCVPTSQATADLAGRLGIPLATLADAMPLDLTVDGADEVDPQLNLIKGLGGALVREKIVAAASRQLVILVDSRKAVKTLGDHGTLPVEVVPFGLALCRARLSALALPTKLRMNGEKPLLTDNGNHILDCAVTAIADPHALEGQLRSVPGVVGTGLFLDMADTVLVLGGEKVDVRQREVPRPADGGPRRPVS